MTNHINIKDDSAQEDIPVRHRSRGSIMTARSITIPKDLDQTINGTAVDNKQTRSQVITELIEDGYKYRKEQ